MRANKNILIIGASRGLGRRTAELLKNHGHRVSGTRRAAQHRESDIDMANMIRLDYTVPQTIYRLLHGLERNKPTIDILINNAATISNINSRASTCSHNFLVNCLGPYMLTSALMERKLILNVINVVSPHSLTTSSTPQMLMALGLQGYFETKRLFLLSQYFLAEKHGVNAYFFSPGAISTQLQSDAIRMSLQKTPRFLAYAMEQMNSLFVSSAKQAAVGLSRMCENLSSMDNHTLIDYARNQQKVITPEFSAARSAYAIVRSYAEKEYVFSCKPPYSVTQ